MHHIYKDYYPGNIVVPVLKDVNLNVEEGEYLAIMGPSGSGKSTLMNIIGCLDKPTKGDFKLDGLDILNLSENALADVRLKKLGFVFQNFQLLPRQTAVENVALPLIYAGVGKRERLKRAAAALDKVGLSDRINFVPNQLSGGQKQSCHCPGHGKPAKDPAGGRAHRSIGFQVQRPGYGSVYHTESGRRDGDHDHP